MLFTPTNVPTGSSQGYGSDTAGTPFVWMPDTQGHRGLIDGGIQMVLLGFTGRCWKHIDRLAPIWAANTPEEDFCVKDDENASIKQMFHTTIAEASS